MAEINFKKMAEGFVKSLREKGFFVSRWVPVEEGLPDKGKYTDFYKCLVAVRYTSRHDICDSITAYFDGKHFYANRYDTISIPGVKAWMPLPEPYMAKEDKE